MTIYGHQHLNVTNAGAHRRFFVETLGGVAKAGSGPDDVVRFPNVLVFLRERAPTGGTKGTTVNHIAFGVPDIRKTVGTVKAAGFPMVTRAEVPASLEVQEDLCYMADQATFVAFTMAPDDTKIEFIEIPSQSEPVALHHIHFSCPNVADMKAWYVKVLGAKPGRRGNFEAADLPGVNLTYSASAAPVVGTRGRALDHIGFEVDGLDIFCEKLGTLGIAVQHGPDHGAGSAATAFMTDPWGTDIELTEGLI